MERDELLQLLFCVRDGKTEPEAALQKLSAAPFENLGYARIDHHRGIRSGAAEVIYGEGKTAEQMAGILSHMAAEGTKNILITRLCAESAALLGESFPLDYDALSRTGVAFPEKKRSTKGKIVIAAAGTSDLPVAEEAARTAETLGNEVERCYDVGVAGIHRLLDCVELLQSATVIVAVAGMEGALPSVIGGLVGCPVIAVPTSVGYGAAFGGVTALLAMLNSCASGVSVVNIDNGFGAGFLASRINHLAG